MDENNKIQRRILIIFISLLIIFILLVVIYVLFFHFRFNSIHNNTFLILTPDINNSVNISKDSIILIPNNIRDDYTLKVERDDILPPSGNILIIVNQSNILINIVGGESIKIISEDLTVDPNSSLKLVSTITDSNLITTFIVID